MKNKKIFQKYMTGLGEIFYKEITDVLKNIYWKTLKPFTDEQCKTAFDCIMVKSKWFPKPAELIEAINQDQVKIEHKALIEANKIIEHLIAYGGSKIPKLNDPISQHLITKRWPYQSWATSIIESEIKWWVKEFCASYEAYDEDPAILIEGTPELKKLASGLFENIK